MITIKGTNYQGEITPPSSKSDGHRALICAALANKTSHLFNLTLSDDIEATILSLSSLGANISLKDQTLTTTPIKKKVDNVVLNVNESGSTLRFLIPLALVLTNESRFVLKGNLINRPITTYLEAFKDQDVLITKLDDGYLVKGHLKSGTFVLDGDVSSQFISGLLFALPLLDGDSKIIIKNKISSLNYILMTIDSLKAFGVNVNFNIEEKTILVPGNQTYQGNDYVVENDFSQASFFLALGLINGQIKVKGMNLNSYQADKNILPILKSMGGNITLQDDLLIASPSKLVGSTISLDENPDLGPILFGLAPFASSPTTFTNIKRLRIKESNRVDAMVNNLHLLGIKTKLLDEDTLTIYPGVINKPNEVLSSYHDHRIFMSLCIITSLLDEVTIDDEKCINKSYPNFLLDLESLKER
jgi:3-phosphoshikimate 1-carboxyvinyltransferase